VSLLTLLWRRIDELQRKSGVRIALTAIAIICVGLVFGWIYARGASLRSDASAIVEAVKDSNLQSSDTVAVDFATKGTVEVDGRIFGNATLAAEARSLYDDSGRMTSPMAAAQMLLRDRVPANVPRFLLEHGDTAVLLGSAVLIALVLSIWTGLAAHLVLTAIAALLLAAPFYLAGSLPWSVAAITAVTLCFCFLLLVRTTAIGLGGAHPVAAIAANVLREALRLRIAGFFIGVLLIVLPLLPIWIDPGEPLRYQVQTFLSRSIGLMFFLAACMTVFLSCATVAFEIRDRQIWQLMTKPVARLQYLLGKWLGVVALNVILLVIGGVVIFVFVRVISARPAKDSEDQLAVNEQVLVARQGTYPDYTRLRLEELEAVVDQRIAADPVLMSEIDSQEKSERDVRRDIKRQVQQEYWGQQRTVPPGAEKQYEFRGLERAKALNAPLTLRYSFDIGRIDPHEVHPVLFKFSEGRYSPRSFVPAQAHVLTLPPALIDEFGNLSITIENAGLMETPQGLQKTPGAGAIIFKADSFEILYRVDGFEPNFVRALLVQLIKLAFLAMLGVCAATLLSFPVACMLSFTVLTIGSLAPFLGMSISEYSIKADSPTTWQALQYVIKQIASASEWMLRAFGEIQPTSLLVEGRIVPWRAVFETLAVIGLIWSGAVFVVGYAAFRRKELAVYSGNT